MDGKRWLVKSGAAKRGKEAWLPRYFKRMRLFGLNPFSGFANGRG